MKIMYGYFEEYDYETSHGGNKTEQCNLCGDYFEKTRPNQRHCAYCEKDGIEIRKGIKRITPKKVKQQRICKQCGKEFFGIDNDFCSIMCRYVHDNEMRTCDNCGKILSASGIVSDPTMKNQYCCVECQKEAEIKAMKRNGLMKKCAQCGNGFIGEDRFCSDSCRNAATKICTVCGEAFLNGKREPQKTECSDKCERLTKRDCTYCHKSLRKLGVKINPNVREQYCSEECKKMDAWELARKAGKVQTCVECGRMFFGIGKYCSDFCRNEAVNLSRLPEEYTQIGNFADETD